MESFPSYNLDVFHCSQFSIEFFNGFPTLTNRPNFNISTVRVHKRASCLPMNRTSNEKYRMRQHWWQKSLEAGIQNLLLYISTSHTFGKCNTQKLTIETRLSSTNFYGPFFCVVFSFSPNHFRSHFETCGTDVVIIHLHSILIERLDIRILIK